MRMRKWFSTIITSEIFLTFMNGFDVYSQVMRMRKWFSTRVTFDIFLIFMNGFHMDSQITSLSIWFSTIFTCEIFVIFLNCFDMNPKRRSPVNDFSQIFVTFMNGFDMTSQVWQKSKWFSTIVTFEFFVAFTKGFGKSHMKTVSDLCELWMVFTCLLIVFATNLVNDFDVFFSDY